MMFYVRLGLGIIMLLCAVEVFRVTRTLNNRELVQVSKRIGLSILSFAVLRIVAGFVDSYIGFTVAYLTTAATYAFWIATYAFFFYHRRILQSDAVGEGGRARISRSVDDIAEEMRRFNRKLDRVIGQ